MRFTLRLRLVPSWHRDERSVPHFSRRAESSREPRVVAVAGAVVCEVRRLLQRRGSERFRRAPACVRLRPPHAEKPAPKSEIPRRGARENSAKLPHLQYVGVIYDPLQVWKRSCRPRGACWKDRNQERPQSRQLRAALLAARRDPPARSASTRRGRRRSGSSSRRCCTSARCSPEGAFSST